VLIEECQERGLFFINDIMNTNGNGLMSVDELDLKYLIANTCMFYNSFFGYLRRLWKRLIQNSTRLLSLTGSNIEHFFKLEIISSSRPIHSQNKRENIFNKR
jgi:hypothetical protein